MVGQGESEGLVPLLQWGRGLLTPEILLTALGVAEDADASMGPGSFDPGNLRATDRSAPIAGGFNGAGVF